ncbi:MAG: hypothetical protein MK101_04190 [Phycisphaerales bacterium]|nr:hypothetical protein [Phycisphaerales bacterium]
MTYPPMPPTDQTAPKRFQTAHERRGNAIILVSALLVLLVLLATVYLTKVRGLREAGQATRKAMQRDSSVEGVAEAIAAEVAGNLFVRNIDYDVNLEYAGGFPPDQGRRTVPDEHAERHGVDPFFAWNHAPFETVPWTNPPDWLTWPIKPGPLRDYVEEGGTFDPASPGVWTWPTELAFDGSAISLFPGYLGGDTGNGVDLSAGVDPTKAVLDPAQNPLGDPGVADTRFLRDLEPQRVGARTRDYESSFDPNYEPLRDLAYTGGRMANMYSHWRHMSYIPAAWNGWRLCRDIADVTGVRTKLGPDGHPDGETAWADQRIYYGGLLDRLDVPVEQFPAMMPTFGAGMDRLTGGFDVDGDGDVTGSSDIDNGASVFLPPDGSAAQIDFTDDTFSYYLTNHWDHWDRLRHWFTPLGYRQAMHAARFGIGNGIPVNLYRMDDLDGDGVTGEVGERPSDQFIKDTPAWHVGRSLTDTDGDGFTDSWWFLTPWEGPDGTRQIVGVSVTDNSGRLNVNTATRFFPYDRVNTSSRYNSESTRGHTPADVAMVGQNFAPFGSNNDTFSPIGRPTWNVGFFDYEGHQPVFLTGDQSNSSFPGLHGGWNRGWSPFLWNPWDATSPVDAMVGWRAERWQEPGDWTRSLLGNLGLRGNLGWPDSGLDDINDRDNRRYLTQTTGGVSRSPQSVTTPFGLSDELELRAYEGNNLPWLFSRLERATGQASEGYGTGEHPLRGQTERAESVQGLDRLDVRQHASDLRHRLTTVNGARNDLLPQHLWWEHRAPRPDPRSFTLVGAAAGSVPTSQAAYDRLWIDARDQMHTKIDLRGWPRQALNSDWLQYVNEALLDQLGWYRQRTFEQRLTPSIMLALTGGDVTERDPRQPGLASASMPLDVNADLIADKPGKRQSYFGYDDASWERTRRIATALGQSIEARRRPRLINPWNDTDVFSGGVTLDMGPYPIDVQDPAHPDAINRKNNVAGAKPLHVFLPGMDPRDDSFLLDYDASTGNQALLGIDQWDGWPQKIGDTPIVGIDPPNLNLVDDAIDLSDAGGLNAVTLAKRWGLTGVPSGPWQTINKPQQADADIEFEYSQERPAAELFEEAWDPHVFVQKAEPQPVIGEVFVAHVGRPWMIPGDIPSAESFGFRRRGNLGSASNEWIMATAYGDDDRSVLDSAGNGTNGNGSDDPITSPPRDADDLDDFIEPAAPVTVMAVQILNPFDVPIRLFDRNPVTGLWDLPRFSLKFLRENRFDPESPAAFELVLAPNSLYAAAPDATMPRIEPLSNGFRDDGLPNNLGAARFSSEDLSSPWFLPPASDDRPYALTILLNGIEGLEGASESFELAANPDAWDATNKVVDASEDAIVGYHPLDAHIYAQGDGVSDEAEAWIDYLDLLPSEQPWGDVVTEPTTGLYRSYLPGDLVWRVVADEDPWSTGNEEAVPLPMYASDWYASDMGEDFEGPSIDPDFGVALELVRKVYLDTDANLVPEDTTFDGVYSHHDAVDVVIDRTVGTDGKDELAVVLTDQMPRFRLPSFQDLNTGADANFVPQPSDQDPPGFPTRVDGIFGNGIGPDIDGDGNADPSVLFPRMLADWPSAINVQDGDSDYQDPDKNGFTTLPPASRLDPYYARWSQWARYARPWSVDDCDVDISIDGDQIPRPEHLARVGRQIARPDRRGPRFAIGEGRVTASWSREAAIGLGTMPNNGASGAVNEVSQLSLAAPVHEHGSHGGAAALREDPLLVDANLPPVDPVEAAQRLLAQGYAGTVLTDLAADTDDSKELARKLRSRRYAEQCARLGANPGYTEPTAVATWTVNDGDVDVDLTPREVLVGVLDDPRYDAGGDPEGGLPANHTLLGGAAWPDSEYTRQEVLDGDPAADGWPLVYVTFESSIPPNPHAQANEGNPMRVGTTYHDALGWNHGRFYDARWDPEGLGRYDFDGNGDADQPLTSDEWNDHHPGSLNGVTPHGNPYAYPWMTRTTRLPWRIKTDSVNGIADTLEWHAFRCEKPHAFGFGATMTSRGRTGDGDWRYGRRDGGWGGDMDGDLDGDNNADTDMLPWSFADKGLYGFREIDGDVLMPSGFTMPSTRIRNYEQVGEVLDEMAAGTELWMPLQDTGEVLDPPVWPTATPNPFFPDLSGQQYIVTRQWPPVPAVPAAGHDSSGASVPGARRTWPVTLRTLPEWLSDMGHGGRLSLNGGNDPFNVVVGANPPGTEAVLGTDAAATSVPDWVLSSDDPRHLDPGQPAAGRVADLFVCDGPGLYDLSDNAHWIDGGDPNGPDGFPDDEYYGTSSYQRATGRDPSFRNASSFEGQSVSGMVNINTAPVEVLRALPHMTRLVHGSPDRQGGTAAYAGMLDSPPASDQTRPISRHPRSGLPEAIVQYRDAMGTPAFERWDAQNDPNGKWSVFSSTRRDLVPGWAAGPSYADRGARFHPFGGQATWNMDDAYASLGKEVIADHCVRTSDGTRGFATIGQLFALRRPAMYDFGLTDFTQDGVEDVDRREPLGSSMNSDAWRIDFAARNPFGWQGEQVEGPFDDQDPDANSPFWDPWRGRYIDNPGAFLSTDTDRLYDAQNHQGFDALLRRADGVYGSAASSQGGLMYPYADPLDPEFNSSMPYVGDPNTAGSTEPRLTEVLLTGDRVAGDKEESALLFSGISNLITTRSDVFTVHLRVRTFKQDPETGVWDATDKANIVDDARYVMVIDRSSVDSPGDQPDILMMERIQD